MAGKPNRTVLGIDPGSKHTGYGLVRQQGSCLNLIDAGRISVKPALPLSERLLIISDGLKNVIERHCPEAVAVEDVFYAKNVRSAIRLGHARGVALLAAAAAGLPVFEYPPASIKMAVAGYGRAEKNQVGLMVCHLLKTNEKLSEDAADALAAAICHLHQNPLLKGM